MFDKHACFLHLRWPEFKFRVALETTTTEETLVEVIFAGRDTSSAVTLFIHFFPNRRVQES